MTNQEIKTVGQTIAAETQIGGNTAERVGGVIEGIGEALDNKDAAVGYYLATMSGSTIYINASSYRLGTGGNLRAKMPAAATTACTLTVGNANAVPLWYNGAAVSADNSWEAGEIVTIFYDGTRFMASNSQGGGGQFGSGEKIKDILLSQALGDGTGTITSQKGVSDAIFNEIDISSIDSLKTLNDALAPSSSLKPTYYTVTATLSNVKLKVGSMAVISDNMRHVVTEIMATHYTLDDTGTLTNEHSDAEIFFIYRSVKLSGGTLPDPAGTWTKWRYVNSSVWSTAAEKIKYDNSQSGLDAENVQEALNEVNKEVLDISTVLHDVTLPSGSTGLISVQSTWLTAGTHYRLQRNGSTNVLRVTAGADTAYVAFLPSYPSKITNNLPVTFCSGTSRELISAGVTKDFEIPDTCTDIIITKALSGKDYTPSSVKVGVKTKEQVIQNTKDIEATNIGSVTFRQGYIKANSTYNDTVKVANRIFSQPIKGNFRVKVKDGYRVRQIRFFDNEGNFIRITASSTTSTEETVYQSSGFVSLNIAKADATASITPDEDIIDSITDVGELFDFVDIIQGGVSVDAISYSATRAHCKVRGAVDVEVNSGYVIRYVCIQYLDGTWELLQDISTTATTFSCPQTKAGDIYITFAMSDATQDIDPSADIIKSIVFDGSEMVKEVVRNIIQNKKKSYLPSKVFTISVDTGVADTQQQTLALQDSQVFETDNGKIYLPPTYSAEGTPTRLIIHCHGASQNYNNGTVFPSSSMNITLDYLLAKGYAVMDVNGMPGTHSFYATTSGNPVALRSYIKAYDWVIKNFNLYKEIFVVGISAGSIPALQISNLDIIPVLASATYCGIMDFSRAWMLLGGYHPNNQGPAIKSYLADKYAFVGTRPTFGNVDPCSPEEWKYIVDNVKQFEGWNTFTMGITSTMTREQYREIVSVVYGSTLPSWIPADYSFDSVQQMLLAFKIPQRGNLSSYQTMIAQEKKLFDTCAIQRQVPIKLFHAVNDGTAPYRYSQYYYEMCKRGGSIAEFRTFPSGGHNPTGNTITHDGISTNVLTVELLNWLQRFE